MAQTNRTYIPSFRPEDIWGAPDPSASQSQPGLLPPLPTQDEIARGSRGLLDYSSLARPAASLASQFVPGLGMAKSIWDFGSGAVGGYDRATKGDTTTQYSLGLDDKGGSKAVEVDQPSFFGKVLKYANPARLAGDVLGYGAGSLLGNGVIDVPASGLLPSPAAPAPQMAADGLLASSRPLAPRTAEIERQAMSATERSLFDAYGKGSSYVPGKGWVADPSKDWQPRAMTAEESAARDAALRLSPGNAGGTFGNGVYQTWYAGQPDPYSLTGNMNDRITSYSFGAGRYENASNPYSSMWGGDSLDTPIFGPGARFVHGDKFNTD